MRKVECAECDKPIEIEDNEIGPWWCFTCECENEEAASEYEDSEQEAYLYGIE